MDFIYFVKWHFCSSVNFQGIMIPEIVIAYQPAAGDNEAFCNKDTYKRHEKDYKWGNKLTHKCNFT